MVIEIKSAAAAVYLGACSSVNAIFIFTCVPPLPIITCESLASVETGSALNKALSQKQTSLFYTTSILLCSYSLLAMMDNQEVQECARFEIDTVCFDHLPNLSDLTAFLCIGALAREVKTNHIQGGPHPNMEGDLLHSQMCVVIIPLLCILFTCIFW
jgi:hypothetical protein